MARKRKPPKPIYPFWSTQTLLAFSVLGGLTYSLFLYQTHQTKRLQLFEQKTEEQALLYERELENERLRQQVSLLEDPSYLLAYAKQTFQTLEDGEILFDINEESGTVTAITANGETTVVHSQEGSSPE